MTTTIRNWWTDESSRPAYPEGSCEHVTDPGSTHPEHPEPPAVCGEPCAGDLCTQHEGAQE